MNSDEIEIIISYESQAIEILHCNLEDKIEDILLKFASKKNLKDCSFLTLYGGNIISEKDSKKTISEIINTRDKFDKKMSMLLYRQNNYSSTTKNKNINIVLMIDPQKIFVLQGTKEETIKTILKKNSSKIDIDINSFVFKYGKENIDINKKFDDIANEIDQKFSGITLYAFTNKKLTVNFIINDNRQFRTECYFEDSIRKICSIYCVTNNKNINNCLFKFNLRDINLDQTFNQLLSKKEDLKAKDGILSINEPITKENNKEIDIIVYEKESFFQKNKIKIIIVLSILCTIIIIAIILIVVLTRKSDSGSGESENPFETITVSQNTIDTKGITQEFTTKRVTKICEPGYFIPDDDETLEDCIKCSLEGCIECKGAYANNECINCGDLESVLKDGKIIECKKTCVKGEEEKCLTCVEDSFECASCNFGYKLVNGKCRPTFYVKAVYHLNVEEDNIDLFSSYCLSSISYLIIEGKNITPSTKSYKFENAGDQTVYIQYKKTISGSSDNKCFLNNKNLISATFTDFDEYFPNLGFISLFEGCSNLISVDLSNSFRYNWAKFEKMFKDCYNLVHVNFIKFTLAANTTHDMFLNCHSLTSIDLSKLDVSKVSSFNNMFSNCYSLETINIQNFKLDMETKIDNMFYNCNSLKSLDLSSFQPYKLTSMISTFSNCSSLTSIILNKMYTNSVIDMTHLFYNCTSLTFLDISSFNTESVLRMNGMFENCKSLTSINFGNNFNTYNVKYMHTLFSNCHSLESIDYPITFKLNNLSSFFINCYSLTSVNLQNFNTLKVSDFRNMFYNCYKLRSIDLSKIVIKDSASMENMTRGCYSLTSLNFQNDVCNLLSIDGIFYDCPNLNYINISFVRSTNINHLLFNGNISNGGTLILKRNFYNTRSSSFKENIPSNWNLILLD